MMEPQLLLSWSLWEKDMCLKKDFYEEDDFRALKDRMTFIDEGVNEVISAEGTYNKRHRECRVQSMLGVQQTGRFG